MTLSASFLSANVFSALLQMSTTGADINSMTIRCVIFLLSLIVHTSKMITIMNFSLVLYESPHFDVNVMRKALLITPQMFMNKRM